MAAAGGSAAAYMAASGEMAGETRHLAKGRAARAARQSMKARLGEQRYFPRQKSVSENINA